MERRAEGGVRVLRGECALQLQRSATSLRPALRLVCGRACAPHELLVLAELDARELWGPGVGGNGRRVKKCDQHNSARWARTALSADPAKAGAGRHARVGVALAVDAAHHGKRLRPALLLCASSDRFQFSRALQARARRGGVPVAAGCPGSVQQRHVAGTANRQEGGCGREAALCHQRCCRAAGRVDCCRPWTWGQASQRRGVTHAAGHQQGTHSCDSKALLLSPRHTRRVHHCVARASESEQPAGGRQGVVPPRVPSPKSHPLSDASEEGKAAAGHQERPAGGRDPGAVLAQRHDARQGVSGGGGHQQGGHIAAVSGSDHHMIVASVQKCTTPHASHSHTPGVRQQEGAAPQGVSRGGDIAQE